jgi:diguanylate cyclase (GGDEF)-like protein
VLVVDDEPEITRSVAELLERDYQVLVANSADEALALLEENDVSVILADQRMPNGSGAELLARSIDVAPEVTRILFTGYSDISAVIEAVNKGQIYYYLAKPWMPEELQAVLSRGLERHRLVSENRELLESLTRANEELEARVRERTEQLETISRKDALTGLANRGWLDETLSLEVERSRRYGSRLSLIMGDLDHFKLVNDSYGHLVGDMVLKVAAEVLQAGVRMTDLVARYGGEEFLIVLPNTGLREACVLADRLREQLQNAPVTFRAEPVTGSFGVVEWRSGELASDTVGRADKAMYAAKEQGRNRVSCDPSVDQEMEERYGAGEPG